MKKVCTKCSILKTNEDFHKSFSSKDGLKPQCKECKNKYAKEYYIKNKDKIRNYDIKRYEENLEQNLKQSRNWKQQNSIYYSQYCKEYYLTHKEQCNQRTRQYKQNNKDKIRIYNKQYRKQRTQIDVQYKLACNLRIRLHKALKNNQKVGSAVHNLGCSIEFLKQHLEQQWQPGMSWENWAKNGWHIDHIKPLASFDLTDKEQLLEACHYTNLQPLWAEENLKKGSRK